MFETKPIRKKYDEYQLSVPIDCVITTRLKEGFTIKTVEAPKGLSTHRYFMICVVHVTTASLTTSAVILFSVMGDVSSSLLLILCCC